MAKWKNQYTPIENINGGNEYEIGDVPSPTMFNTAVENSNVAAQLGLNQPDNSDAHLVGTPSVSIVETPQGNKLKFSNLKGQKGDWLFSFRVDEKGDLIVSYDDAVTNEPNFGINSQGQLVFHNGESEVNLGRVKGDNATEVGLIKQELGDSSSDTISQRAITGELGNKLDKAQCNLQFNQLFKPDYIKNHTEKNVVFTNNGDGSVSLNGTATSKVIFLFRDIFLDHTHIYYYSTNPSSARSITTFVNKYDGGQSYLWRTTILKNCTKINYVYDEDSDLNFNYTIKPILIDLTKMFGAGNEPQTINEAEKYIKYGTYYPYREPVNKAELIELASKVQTNTTEISKKLNGKTLHSQSISKLDEKGTYIISMIDSNIKIVGPTETIPIEHCYTLIISISGGYAIFSGLRVSGQTTNYIRLFPDGSINIDGISANNEITKLQEG